jgi:hypothetical protein
MVSVDFDETSRRSLLSYRVRGYIRKPIDRLEAIDDE